ncbi:hypothetical protein ACIP4W_36295 [Streptomyces sp. NPDC088846]|uniref:hypothetical protein n=1 Tax=Streptomyces sp. NPDC088846 TaxID=3365908 RepID=UPI00382CEE24
MSAGSTGFLVEDPGADVWDYGDFPYGLEPLLMPPVGLATATSGAPPAFGAPADTGFARRRLSALIGDGPSDAAGPAPAQSYDQLFWFRWITGHQATFLIWHLMGRLIEAVPEETGPDRTVLARLEAYTYGYCAMLLYTGSCPHTLYESLIRPRMSLQHRSFSGTWAPDYVSVRRLFRGRRLPWTTSPEAARLSEAVETNKAIHDGIASELVPSGGSLLQQTLEDTAVRPSERTAVIYDNFFMTLRTQVHPDLVTAQLLHRLKAVALDIAANGLYPLGRGSAAGRPEELCSEAVVDCERRVDEILHRVGEATADDVWERLASG